MNAKFFINDYEYKFVFGAWWLKIFYHDISGLVGFKDEVEAKLCNEKTKFSILGEISPIFKQRNKKFEFLMEYPDYGEDYFYRWQQNNNPLEEVETGLETADGFIDLHHPNDLSNTIPFQGLVRTSAPLESPLALLNGQPSIVGVSGWNYAIGQYQDQYYTNANSNHIYNIPIGNDKGANYVYLWMKIPPFPLFTSYSQFSFRFLSQILSFFMILLK